MDHAEAVLVSLAQHGDVDAFTEIVRRRQTSVRQLMYRLSGDVSLAEDLAQQVFIKLWQNMHSLRDVQRFPGWLKKMAVNTFTSHVRKRQLPDASEPVETPTDFRDPTLVDDLSRALATLDESPRLCVVLAYLEGMTNEEITMATGLPLGTVKSHIRRGSEKLRSYLSSYDLNSESDHE